MRLNIQDGADGKRRESTDAMRATVRPIRERGRDTIRVPSRDTMRDRTRDFPSPIPSRNPNPSRE